ncbi:hypothetical protein AV530_018659 [Patagioenas fasciata monilis]|uniref:Uncharacterized protein n=1 Tax=Patagioenas fasciata monilis TaxID=372326 RepID=A0A1V4JKA6_PATFA|nr:hypothetical protein AV530_018659 [Patagioenas fasciata monilis]
MKTTDNATKILPHPPVCEVTLVMDQFHLLITATKKKQLWEFIWASVESWQDEKRKPKSSSQDMKFNPCSRI